tara:strand:+ start:71841 stop:72680 length:840 start_codon:yes stop_codon:yes gene_type:complete
MKDFEIQLHDFKTKLKEIYRSTTDIKKQANMAIVHCNTVLGNLKKQLAGHHFHTPEDEIHFFKNIKSYPLGYLIYFAKIRSFELRIAYDSIAAKKKAVNRELKRTNKFFQQHFDFFQYIDQDLDHLDQLYFTRENNSMLLLAEPIISFVDPHFNTSHDQLYARIKAMQCFTSYLHNRYVAIDRPELFQGNHIHKRSRLHWTSSKVALTELIYALHSSKVLNNGNTDIKEIAETFQKVFNYDLGDFYKIFSEIKSRQKSRTKFLDQITIDLLDHMDRSEN